MYKTDTGQKFITVVTDEVTNYWVTMFNEDQAFYLVVYSIYAKD